MLLYYCAGVDTPAYLRQITTERSIRTLVKTGKNMKLICQATDGLLTNFLKCEKNMHMAINVIISIIEIVWVGPVQAMKNIRVALLYY